MSDPAANARLEFTGTPLEILRWFALAVVGTALVIPLAWVSAGIAKWVCERTRFSDGTTVEFRGTGGDVLVWSVFLALTIGGATWGLYGVRNEGIVAILVVLLIFFTIVAAIAHTLIKWFVFNAQLSSGPQLSFMGSFVDLFGRFVAGIWQGWAVRHVRGRGVSFVFDASELDVFWRHVVCIVATLLLIPIPWVWLWFVRWLVGNVAMTRNQEDEFTVPV